MTLLDDDRFIERLRARDERAFNELVRLYERKIYALVFRMIGRRDEAEDLAQEVFVQVFKSLDQFRGDAKLSTWVYRIAINLCKNRSKYLSRRHANQHGELEAVADRATLHEAKGVTASDVARPDDAFAGREAERVVQIALTQLEPDFREVVILCDAEGLTYDEIAAITGVAIGTVKSRLHRARAQLKALVEEALGEPLP